MVTHATHANACISTKPRKEQLRTNLSRQENTSRRSWLLGDASSGFKDWAVLFVLLLMAFGMAGTSFAQPTNLRTNRKSLPLVGKSTLPQVVREGSATAGGALSGKGDAARSVCPESAPHGGGGTVP